MIDRIEYMHNKSLLHRDIKPGNFVLGLNEENHILYLIDVEFMKKYRSARTLKHIEFRENTEIIGNPFFSSINSLKGYEQSRRDDLEAIGYSLIYLLRGNLPWEGLKVRHRHELLKKILNLKESIPLEELCKGFPIEFSEYMDYTRKLEFEQEPDYKYLKWLFYNVLYKYNYEFDFWYDWVKEKPNIKDIISIERYINRNVIK